MKPVVEVDQRQSQEYIGRPKHNRSALASAASLERDDFRGDIFEQLFSEFIETILNIMQ